MYSCQPCRSSHAGRSRPTYPSMSYIQPLPWPNHAPSASAGSSAPRHRVPTSKTPKNPAHDQQLRSTPQINTSAQHLRSTPQINTSDQHLGSTAHDWINMVPVWHDRHRQTRSLLSQWREKFLSSHMAAFRHCRCGITWTFPVRSSDDCNSVFRQFCTSAREST